MLETKIEAILLRGPAKAGIYAFKISAVIHFLIIKR